MRTTRTVLPAARAAALTVCLAVLLALTLAGCSSLMSGFSPSSMFDTAIVAAAGNPDDVSKMQTLQKAGEAVLPAYLPLGLRQNTLPQ